MTPALVSLIRHSQRFAQRRVFGITFVLLACAAPPSARAEFTTVINVPPDEAPDAIGLGVQVNVRDGGTIVASIDAFDGSEVNVFDGLVELDLNMFDGSAANVSGGTVTRLIRGFSGSAVTLSGGEVGGVQFAFGSTLDILGTSFALGGVDLTETLSLNVPFELTDRDVTLSGILLDGMPFSFDLRSTPISAGDSFATDALLRITLTSQPGDFDADGDVDGADLVTWQRGASPDSLSEDDLVAWQTKFAATAPSAGNSLAVPEPSSWLLALVCTTAIVRRHNSFLTVRYE